MITFQDVTVTTEKSEIKFDNQIGHCILHMDYKFWKIN